MSTGPPSVLDRAEVFSLMFLHFMRNYAISAYETVTPPLMLAYFNWGVLEVSILFSVCGCCSVVILFLLRKSLMSDAAGLLQF